MCLEKLLAGKRTESRLDKLGNDVPVFITQVVLLTQPIDRLVAHKGLGIDPTVQPSAWSCL